MIGIGSLAAFAEEIYEIDGDDQHEQNLVISIYLPSNEQYNFDTITRENNDVMQTIELPSSPTGIVVIVEGSGVAVVQVRMYTLNICLAVLTKYLCGLKLLRGEFDKLISSLNFSTYKSHVIIQFIISRQGWGICSLGLLNILDA